MYLINELYKKKQHKTAFQRRKLLTNKQQQKCERPIFMSKCFVPFKLKPSLAKKKQCLAPCNQQKTP